MSYLQTFADLFSGRPDAYGMNNCCIKEKVTLDIYKKHLDGWQRIGTYPIYHKQLVNWIAVDLDEDDFEKTLTIKRKLEEYKLNIYIERSKSKGYHLWCFFDRAIRAVLPRLVFEEALESLGFICEIFPKQDEINASLPYGNYINLPLFGGDIKNKKTIFIDENDKVFIDKIADLSKIKKTKGAIIENYIINNHLSRKKIIMQETSHIERITPTRDLPCIVNIKKGVGKGHRENACFRLAINYKEKGYNQTDTETLIISWNQKNQAPLSERKLTTTVNSVFTKNYKSYGCDDPVIQPYCDKENCPLTNAQLRKEQINEGVITMTFRDREVMVFGKKNYEYRLTNFEFTKSGNFKVSLTLSRDARILFKDTIKLSTASNRARFINAAQDPELDADLIKLEDLVKKQIEKEEHDKLTAPKQLYVMTEGEKNEAIKFLESSPNMLYKALEVTNRMGVVGEETLRLMIYLCFTSRITKEPLSMTVKGEASSGKSFACQNMQKLIPEEGYHFITRATQNAFFHLAEDGMQNRIIYINELPGSESADYSIRTAQSEGDLILMMPIKDQATGNMETVTKRVKGPVGFLVTTTKAQMHDENETRNFSVFSDDSPQLTQKIGDITIRKAMGETFKVEEKELNLWKNVQRLLNADFKVIIPYAKEVFSVFPDKPVRIRRDRERFRVLIEIVTVLHQFHREQKKQKNGSIHLISTLADYYVAKVVAEATLTYTIYEIGPSAEQLWKAIKSMNEANPEVNETDELDFVFKHKNVAEYMDWKVDKVKKWMYVLMRANLIEYHEKGSGGRGKASLFKISKRGLEWSSSSLGFLPKIEDIYDKYECNKDIFYNPISGDSIDPHMSEAPEGLLDD